jgi:hypothetical protein
LGGALFKIMHWPGAGIFLMVALPFPFLVFLPVYLYVTSRLCMFSFSWPTSQSFQCFWR